MSGALEGVNVLDLSRILAGPTCTQLLGDMGAEVIKIENPLTGGDDTRAWGPPYVAKANGEASDLSSYFNCANRNKRSLALDISTQEGQQIIKDLVRNSDVFIENFKPGGLKRYQLDYETISAINPEIVYCSISGFGQTGPNAHKPGYDLMAQGYGGIMSITGEPEGEPMKVGVGIADVMCGMYASNAILAALLHKNKTGEGQHIDISLVDSQIAWLVNQGTNYLTDGRDPARYGNGHPNIAPYQTYRTSDGNVIVAVGNDRQFRRFCEYLSFEQLADDPRFSTNPMRLENREALNELISPALKSKTSSEIVEGLEELGVPVGPVNTMRNVFESPQVKAREMKISLKSGPLGTDVPLIGNPIKFSKTPITYRYAPPVFGEHTEQILSLIHNSKHK